MFPASGGGGDELRSGVGEGRGKGRGSIHFKTWASSAQQERARLLFFFLLSSLGACACGVCLQMHVPLHRDICS